MDYETLLNDKQLAAVKSSSQYVRIIAGAGSGKTRVLTYRISYLISDFHVSPSRILAIAFTNKVAREMNDRAAKLVNELLGYTPALNISTFHAFCSKFLRIEHEAFGYPAHFTIFDEDDQKRLIKNVATEFGHKKSDEIVKKATEYIHKKKGKGLYPWDISIGDDVSKEEKACHQIYTRYEEAKTECYALDFDDLLLKTIMILDGDPVIQYKWSHRFDHILVDEFQDTNDIQYKLLKLLTCSETCLYVVGDPDQTIYTWRGANQGIIIDFEKTYHGAETVILNENYRSTGKILKAANTLIMKNKKRVPKDLFTNHAEGEDIEVNSLSNAENEASWVAQKIASIGNRQRNEDGPVYSNIAVLYRSSYMTRSFESALKDRRIPYRIFGGVRFYERKEIKDLLAYFNLLVNPLDNIAFERIINVPKRSIGETSIDRIRQEAKDHGLSEYNYMANIQKYSDETSLPSRVVISATSMIDLMEKTKERLKEGLEVYSAILKNFTTELGYFDYLKDTQETDEDRIGNINELFDDISNFIRKNPDSKFEEYLQNVALLSAQDDIEGGNFVSFMTIHVAKGLEFDNVFVISMNDGMFPSARSLTETGMDALEEERRLAYVAFTRAKKQLRISCNRGYSFQTDSHGMPSQFIREAGLAIPRNMDYESYSSWAHQKSKPTKKGNYAGESSFFFDDGPSSDPFETEKRYQEKPQTTAPADNGITDWKVGDSVHHEKFGNGKVVTVIDETMIVVAFDTAGKKTLLSSHRMLSRTNSKGE